MPRVVYGGRLSYRIECATVLGWLAAVVGLRHLFGKRLAPDWDWRFETSVRFLRRHMNRALGFDDMREGRAFFDSVMLLGDDVPAVTIEPFAGAGIRGDRITPDGAAEGVTLLYFHGGGYALSAKITRHMMALIAEATRTETFAVDYRLTPEHPHPAQIEDALAAYRHLVERGTDPRRLVIAGDSAGGHLTLMLLAVLREAGLPQPALAVGLCPWTDVGPRGASLKGNDRFDLVQSWQTERFRQWLIAASDPGREALSPIHRDYRDTAPIYLQGGGREILIDMIRDFAGELQRQGCAVMLDVWPTMVHEFQGSGSLLADSREALRRLGLLFQLIRDGRGLGDLPASPRTERRSIGSPVAFGHDGPSPPTSPSSSHEPESRE